MICSSRKASSELLKLLCVLQSLNLQLSSQGSSNLKQQSNSNVPVPVPVTVNEKLNSDANQNGCITSLAVRTNPP